jgi:hypothetical protein
MDYPIIAIAHITFGSKKFEDRDAQAIETLLRQDPNVYHVQVDPKKITFYIWGREHVDYQVLDKIKEELMTKNYSDFLLAADEYIKAGQRYYYNAAERRNGGRIPHEHGQS